MEVGYNSIFVRKYSRGNSYAIENDVENKRYKVKFINKYSFSVVFVALLTFLIVGLVTLIFSYIPVERDYTNKRYQRREKNAVLFHKDVSIKCENDVCKPLAEIEKEYFDKLKESLRKEGYNFVDKDSIFTGPESYDYITKLELETIANYLVELYVELNENFEVPTIVKFKKFMKEFNREITAQHDYKRRYRNFRSNRIFIETHNSDTNKLYTMGYTQAADVNEEDLDLPILDRYTLRYMKDDEFTETGDEDDKFNKSGIIFDWRQHGHVVPIRDQGKCGTCWAFASADLVSSMVSIKTNVLKMYSIQQLSDCILPFFSCSSGGIPEAALLYMKRANYCTEEEYPYMMADYACIQPNICKDRIQIKSIVDLKNLNLEKYLENEGPFLFTMFVSKEFMFYKEGIFNGECGKLSNHAVVVVGHGYDKKEDVNYWIVKNSWTEDWGEKGYFRLINAQDIIKGRKSYYCKMNNRSTGIRLK